MSLPPEKDPLLSEMVAAIVREVHPLKVILFGSRARQTAGKDSDVDLLVIEEQPFDATRSRRREMTRLLLALSGFSAPTDILVVSRDEVEHWKSSINHVIGRALREGVVLYG